ncbi:hypothetical protein ACUHGC_01325 [Testudinibacter sp. P27/CKL/0425]
MNTAQTVPSHELPSASSKNWQAWLLVAVLIYLLLAAVGAIGSGFKIATGSNAKELFSFASNPFVALIVGIVTTALIQSSSTVTSIIVGMVAGGLPVSMAIPMVMGANIGTSLTSTIVSLGHIKNPDEFRRAFSAATVHDSFNILAVAIMLPLELIFRPLQNSSAYLAQLFVSDSNMSMSGMNFMKTLLAPADNVLKMLTGWLPGIWSGLLLIVLGVVLILFVVSQIGKVLRKVMVGKAKDVLNAAVGRGPVSGMLSGTLITVMVQSSSTTTALIVPMAGTGVFTLKQVYPFTLGTNIGTTVTALLAATAISGPAAQVALQIALVHLLFNVFGIGLIYVLPLLRQVPIIMATTLAEWGLKNKMYVFAYMFGVFFAIPLAIIGIGQLL